jgi:uncharacterized membrane protein HdeD (DUF308 family)
MNRIIGIALLAVGLIAGAYAFSRHEENKTILEIGDVEIKAGNRKPSNNTQLYYIIAAVGILGGIVMLSSKKRTA